VWGKVVVGSRLALRVFLQVLHFSSLHKKPTSPKMTRIENPHVNQSKMMMASSLKFVIYLYMTVAELNGGPIEFVNFFH